MFLAKKAGVRRYANSLIIRSDAAPFLRQGTALQKNTVMHYGKSPAVRQGF